MEHNEGDVHVWVRKPDTPVSKIMKTIFERRIFTLWVTFMTGDASSSHDAITSVHFDRAARSWFLPTVKRHVVGLLGDTTSLSRNNEIFMS